MQLSGLQQLTRAENKMERSHHSDRGRVKGISTRIINKSTISNLRCN